MLPISRKKLNLIVLSALFFVAQAQALQSDKDQPINVISNEQTADFNNNTASFSGNVVITQGSIKITADKVTIKRDASGKLDSIKAQGTPVAFSQKMDNGKTIQSRSNSLSYTTANNTIVLSGKAKIMQGESQLSGERIEYNVSTRKMRANNTDTQGGRVSSTFIPSEVKNDK